MSRRKSAGGKGLTENYVLEKMMRDKGALLWTKDAELDCKEAIVKEYLTLHPGQLVKGYNYKEEDNSPKAQYNKKIAEAVAAGDYDLASELRRARDETEDQRIEDEGSKITGYVGSLNVKRNPRRTVLKSFRASGLKGRPGMGKGQVPTFVGRQNFAVTLRHGNDDHLPRDRFGNPIQPPKAKKRFNFFERDLRVKTKVPWRDQKMWNWPLTGKPIVEDPRAQK